MEGRCFFPLEFRLSEIRTEPYRPRILEITRVMSLNASPDAKGVCEDTLGEKLAEDGSGS